MFEKSNNSDSLIDNCCYEIKAEDKHQIIFDGEKKFGRLIYLNKDKDITYARFLNDNGLVTKIIGFDAKWKEGRFIEFL